MTTPQCRRLIEAVFALFLASVACFRCTTQSPDADLERRYQQALERSEQAGRLDPTLFEPLAQQFPSSPEVHLLLANIYTLSAFAENRFENALKEYNAAIQLDPTSVAAFVNRGVMRCIQHEDALLVAALGRTIPEEANRAGREAIMDFDKAMELNPNLFSAHFNKGVVLKTLGKEREAISSFDRAIAIGTKAPTMVRPTVAEEGVREFLGTGHPMCTMSQFREYMVQNHMTVIANDQRVVRLSTSLVFVPGNNDMVAFAHYHKGVAYAGANVRDYRHAVESLTQAIEMNPKVPVFYSMRALALVGMGEGAKTVEDMERVQQLAEGFVEAAGLEGPPSLSPDSAAESSAEQARLRSSPLPSQGNAGVIPTFHSKDGEYSFQINYSSSAAVDIVGGAAVAEWIDRISKQGKWTYVLHPVNLVNPDTGMVEAPKYGVDQFARLYGGGELAALVIKWVKASREARIEDEFRQAKVVLQREGQWVQGSDTLVTIGGAKAMKGTYTLDLHGTKLYNTFILVHPRGIRYEIAFSYTRSFSDPDSTLDLLCRTIHFATN